MRGSTVISFYHSDPPTKEEEVATAVASICSAHGFTSVRGNPLQNPADIEPIRRLELNKEGNQIAIGIQPGELGESQINTMSITTDASNVTDSGEDTDDYTGFTATLLDVVRSLAIELETDYVAALNPDAGYGGVSGTDAMLTGEEFDVTRIPWLGIYGDPLLDQFGGRERVLETPAWRVEDLGPAGVLVIKTKRPWADASRDHPVDRYLLDGEDEPTDGSDADSLGLKDPFAALSAGDYGADVCVAPEDIDPEFPNEDLQLERVYVDENDDLRRVDDDTFVRNVVDGHYEDDGAFLEAMLSEVPDDVDHDRLRVSTLLHERIPTAFVRLEDPDDENVVTRVLGLGVGIDKHDLLFSLARVANEGEFKDDEMASIEGALETLADVDDPEVAEQIIEERLLL
ncbi:hypothetical protein [Halomicrobium salinisoli]|uniref:hypothetical protein n=1 Tax=Halomicrobium salinisoli TaxID=2878391 RepID=UPI001CEFC336|nr:hypothetical protein [Halomicrobium salinisoli]